MRKRAPRAISPPYVQVCTSIVEIWLCMRVLLVCIRVCVGVRVLVRAGVCERV